MHPILAGVAWGGLKKATLHLLPKVAKVGSRLAPYYALKWSTYFIAKRSIEKHGLPTIYRWSLRKNRLLMDEKHRNTEDAIKIIFRSPELISEKRDEIDRVITKIVLQGRENERPGEPEFIMSDLEMYLRMRGLDLSDIKNN